MTKTSDNKPKGQVIKPYTEEQIIDHSGKCGGRRNLREIPITVDDGDYEFWYLVKKPSRAVLEAIASEESKKDKGSITTIQKLMMGCVLEGDKEAYEFDGAIYGQLIRQIGELVTQGKSEVKKL